MVGTVVYDLNVSFDRAPLQYRLQPVRGSDLTLETYNDYSFYCVLLSPPAVAESGHSDWATGCTSMTEGESWYCSRCG
jgi:hypothetical protein